MSSKEQGAKIWLIQAVREWGTREPHVIYYMVGYRRAINAPSKAGFIALNKESEDDRVYYRPVNVVCDRLPDGASESTFAEIYG
jgi:hypothetical protein